MALTHVRSLLDPKVTSPKVLDVGFACTFVAFTAAGFAGTASSEICQSLGRASSSTLDRLLLIERNTVRQEDELLTLARNEAGDMGGNAIVPITAASAGKQSFAVYRCP